MGVYEDLGIRPIVNAAATLTRLGGSTLPREVVSAMAEASTSFVDMEQFERAVSTRIAELVGVPACFVSSGASAGLLLGILAALSGPDMAAIARLMSDDEPSPRRSVVMHAAQRNPYDRVLRLTPVRRVTVGDTWQTFDWELEAALDRDVAAVLFFAGAHMARGALPLETVLTLAHGRGVPVIVDAAAQAIPRANLHAFVDAGADLVVFSGGKAIRGPQATGLVVGRPDLVEACRLHGAPNQRLGRPLKVGKEELAGILAAVRRFLAVDEEAERAQWEATVEHWRSGLTNVANVAISREFPGEAGLPIPRLRIEPLNPAQRSVTDLVARLRGGSPPIEVISDGVAIRLAPDCLGAGEEAIVLSRMREALEVSRE